MNEEYTQEMHEETLKKMRIPVREFEPFKCYIKTTPTQAKQIESLRTIQSRKEFVYTCFEQGIHLISLLQKEHLLGRRGEIMGFLDARAQELMRLSAESDTIGVYDKNGNLE